MTLSKEEAKVFLTKDDLERLEKDIEKSRMRAPLGADLNPGITVRGKIVPFFTALELIGTL